MTDPYDPPHPDGPDDIDDLPAPLTSVSWLDDDDPADDDWAVPFRPLTVEVVETALD